MKVIISTTGTSLFTNICRLDENFKKNYERLVRDQDTDCERYIEENVFKEFRVKNIEKISAELNSISKIGIEEGDKLYFLSTDTAEGRLAADILKSYFEKNYDVFVKNEGIKELQVKDHKKFERDGAKNLIDKIIEIMDSNYGLEIILNPTGGYKGLVPYVTMLGMIFKKKTCYIYEGTNSLITLPHIPIDFNYRFIEENEHRFKLINENQCIKAEEFYKGIDFYDRNNFSSLIIEEDGMVTFSAIGEMIYKNYESINEKHIIMLSSAADKKLKDLDKNQRLQFGDMFKKLLNPDLRSNNMHEKMDERVTDCYLMKEGNTKERIFYYMKGDIPYVADIAMHGYDYENMLKNCLVKKNNYKDYIEFNVDK